MPNQSQADVRAGRALSGIVLHLLCGLALLTLLAAPASAQKDDDFWDDSPKKAKAAKVKPSKVPRIQLIADRMVWDGRSPVPADVPLKFGVLPPDIDPPAGVRYRLASASLYYTDPGSQYGVTEVGKAQSSKPGEPLLYLLTSDIIQKLYNKSNSKARLVFSAEKIIRILPDGSEQEEPLKGKQLFLSIPIARE